MKKVTTFSDIVINLIVSFWVQRFKVTKVQMFYKFFEFLIILSFKFKLAKVCKHLIFVPLHVCDFEPYINYQQNEVLFRCSLVFKLK